MQLRRETEKILTPQLPLLKLSSLEVFWLTANNSVLLFFTFIILWNFHEFQKKRCTKASERAFHHL